MAPGRKSIDVVIKKVKKRLDSGKKFGLGLAQFKNKCKRLMSYPGSHKLRKATRKIKCRKSYSKLLPRIKKTLQRYHSYDDNYNDVDRAEKVEEDHDFENEMEMIIEKMNAYI